MMFCAWPAVTLPAPTPPRASDSAAGGYDGSRSIARRYARPAPAASPDASAMRPR